MIAAYVGGIVGWLIACFLAGAIPTWKKLVGACVEAILWPISLFVLIVLRLVRQ